MEIKKISNIDLISSSRNYSEYLEKMTINMDDKIDFLINNINRFNIIIDIGCADGVLLSRIKSMFENIICIGYDIDSKIIEKAKIDSVNKNLDIVFTNNQNELLNLVNNLKKYYPSYKILVNMSSLLHEIYSYCTIEQQDNFLKMVESIEPDYISIRDFYIEDSIKIKKPNNAIADKVESYFCKITPIQPKIKNIGNNFLNSWEFLYGKVREHNASLIHITLKLKSLKQSKEIMEREFFENYLSLTDSKLKAFTKLGKNTYNTLYKERYSTNSFKNNLKKEIKLTNEEINSLPNTKIKLLLEKQKNYCSNINNYQTK